MLVACGGGGRARRRRPPSTDVSITGKAVDGALQGATACYDLNDNGACDSGEPSSGQRCKRRLHPQRRRGGRGQAPHRRQPFPPPPWTPTPAPRWARPTSCRRPPPASSAAHSVFVSPLSTLVQLHADTTGKTVVDATSFVQTQLNLTVSPLDDFTAATNAANAVAANAARLVRLTQVQQTAAVAPAVGQSDLSGAPLPRPMSTRRWPMR
jgi:hypothetical protein